MLWERDSLTPIHRAIVWQDRRTAQACEALVDDGHSDRVRQITGLVIDSFLSGTKIAWLLDEVDGARDRANAGELAFGTMDTWLLARMTGGRAHVTEPSNASRTMLYDIHRGAWSDQMCDLLDVPVALLPEVKDSAGEFAITDPELFLGIEAPVTGVLGDQQSALAGQGAFEPGMSKNTYGTGSFMLFNTGENPVISQQGLLTSVGWQFDGKPTYVLEGSIFVTGASVQWLRDQLGVIEDAAESAELAEQVPSGNEGVYLVPAFAGLGAPYWDPHARAALVGMTRGTDRRHLARAALESMAYQSYDVAESMAREADTELKELRVDGGAAANDVLCQFQADILGIDVVRPTQLETTVLGAALAAGLGAGIWESTDELADKWELERRFTPTMDESEREHLTRGWAAAVERAGGWAKVIA